MLHITFSSDFHESSFEILENIAFWYRKTCPPIEIRKGFTAARDKAARFVQEYPDFGRGVSGGRVFSFKYKSRKYIVLYNIENGEIILRDIADGRSRKASKWLEGLEDL
ncbi:hypothetical protein [Adlercreutzia sp. ZJ154]|uniref:hypothetical protein n=1 Tax=Adlercreutzia sp. ZJ154 TaxID=2709790 RepID=UPI0013EDDA2A|nr:hypothetical protein [Adlercreutzia sp. ZJ154]